MDTNRDNCIKQGQKVTYPTTVSTVLWGCKRAGHHCELVKTTEAQVVSDDDVSDRVEDKLNVVCVCSTGDVRVDLLFD